MLLSPSALSFHRFVCEAKPMKSVPGDQSWFRTKHIFFSILLSSLLCVARKNASENEDGRESRKEEFLIVMSESSSSYYFSSFSLTGDLFDISLLHQKSPFTKQIEFVFNFSFYE